MEIALRNRKGYLGRVTSSGRNVMVTLRKTDVYELDCRARNPVIKCLGGRVWITQKGDFEDYFIKQGQTFNVDQPGKVVVQGFPYGTFAVCVC